MYRRESIESTSKALAKVDYVNDIIEEDEILFKLASKGNQYDQESTLGKKVLLEEVADIFGLWDNPINEEDEKNNGFDRLAYMFKGNSKERNRYLK
jgi:hypothetical protein